nr:EthD family reductase [uncultured Roseateles sp.]
MIKVSVMYPYAAEARFDHHYYLNSHMPMVKRLMGEACLSYTVDKGLAGSAPGAPPSFITMCHMLCSSVESFQAAFAPHAKAIMADIPNYTDLSPVLQINEVLVG